MDSNEGNITDIMRTALVEYNLSNMDTINGWRGPTDF